jgi:hypothetical protein
MSDDARNHEREEMFVFARIWSERRALRRVVNVFKSVSVRCYCETQLSAVRLRCYILISNIAIVSSVELLCNFGFIRPVRNT